MVKIKVLSANMWLLPPPASLDYNKRINNFIKLVRKLDPDVIHLQEVWLKSHVRQIQKLLCNYNHNSTRSIFFNKSGLVTFTKDKMISTDFLKFKNERNSKALEVIAQKGYLVSKFERDGKTITTINTHIYQANNSKSLNFKLYQIKQVIEFAVKNEHVIIAGDINTITKHYKELLKDFSVDIKIPISYSKENKYTSMLINMVLNKGGIYNKRPDRIIFYNSKKIKLDVRAIKKPIISDHYPLYTEINI